MNHLGPAVNWVQKATTTYLQMRIAVVTGLILVATGSFSLGRQLAADRLFIHQALSTELLFGFDFQPDGEVLEEVRK